MMRVLNLLLDWLAGLPRPAKRAVVISIDVLLLIASIWLAYSLRMSTWIYWNPAIQKMLTGALPVMLVTFTIAGMYRSIFRFAGIGMLRVIAQAFLAYSVIIAAIYMAWGFEGVPRTMGLLQPIILFVLVAGSRAMFRLLMVDVRGRHNFEGIRRRVLIYGAGVSGQQLASSMRADPEMQVMGFIDDDLRLVGQKLDGERIYGSDHLREVIDATGASDVVLAMPSASRKRRKEIIRSLTPYPVRVKTLPHIAEVLGEQVSISDIRPIEIEDLLGRDQVTPNEMLLGRTVFDKAVMVTGAGGSIGSELCRQIIHIGARKLVLFEISEFGLYAIEGELRKLASKLQRDRIEIVAVLGSVRDEVALKEVFTQHALDTVFHAAAYKHVPLVEANPFEGVRNNVEGTFLLCSAAEQAGVNDFILISTDKAVRPTNIMGASKRAAEQVIQALDRKSSRICCSMVRFGNVLGSSGSVVPLFRSQIEGGGPITLTHRDVTRYFMTIPEAANLVIQAAGLAQGGEVFVLDMGKPMRIYDLARTMIQLSGLTVRDETRPDGDIGIVEIGLRAGEKLYEELLIGKMPKATAHPRIMMAHEDFLGWDEIRAWLDRLGQCSNPTELVTHLQELVPEFVHRRDN